MHRVVVTTHQDQVISSANVPQERLVEHVAPYAQSPETWIYINGRLLPPEQRAAFLEQIAADAAAQAASSQSPRPAEASPPPSPSPSPSSSPAAVPEPEAVVTWMDILQRGLEEVRRGSIQNLHDIQEFTRRSSEMHLQMQRELADEAVRQRKLTAQSLADIDLLDRSVKTTQLNDALLDARRAFGQAAPLPAAAAAPSAGFAVGDWIRGFMDFAGNQ